MTNELDQLQCAGGKPPTANAQSALFSDESHTHAHTYTQSVSFLIRRNQSIWRCTDESSVKFDLYLEVGLKKTESVRSLHVF